MKPFARSILAVALGLASAAPLAAGADQPPVHVRGSISSVSASSMTVATAKGPVVIALGPKTGVAGVLPSTTDAIVPGTFIGVANVAGNGPARALEVVVFPEALRGRGEGDYPWDLPAGGGHTAMTNGTVAARHGSSMTNATVAHVTSGATKTVSVTYKGGTKQISIPPNAPIVRLEPGTRSLLVAGARVFTVAVLAGGKLSAAYVAVGEKGTIPPM
ncbi:MAG: metal ABC transporter permease [Candidatus Eremiobacteraeota bacterium]|nr:metal ABC transporter permease [Candidatus Eremiobacteraeota bacterium]